MRNQETILSFLQKLTKIVTDEAAGNPAFAARLSDLIGAAPLRAVAGKPKVKATPKLSRKLPDLFDECLARGPEEFHFWLRAMPVDTLKTIIKANDMDAARRAARWKDTAKLARHIFEQTQARMKRGSAFLPPVISQPAQPANRARARPPQ